MCTLFLYLASTRTLPLVWNVTGCPFWTQYNANHYDYWAVPHGKPKVKEQRKSSIKARFKVTLVTRYTWAESLLSERRKSFSLRPMFREILENSCDLFLLDVKENLGSRDGSVGTATRYGLEGPGIESR